MLRLQPLVLALLAAAGPFVVPASALLGDAAAAAAARSAGTAAQLGPSYDPEEEEVEKKKKVPIELYYESQCPGCRATITQSFAEAYAAKDFLKMADVTLVPFGNARESGSSPNFEFECQHGPSECMYNLIETCALSKISCPYMQFQLIDCVEGHDENREPKQDYDSVLETCTKAAKVDDKVTESIKQCYKGPEGNALEHDMATKTDALDPKHTYVPWIVVNGEHDEKVQREVMASLLKYVCGTYAGKHKSADCPKEGNLRVGAPPSAGEEEDVCRRDGVTPEVQ